MTTQLANLNIQIKPGNDLEQRANKWLAILNDAALESTACDDFEVFFIESLAIVGVSVSYDADDAMLSLEAGSALGYCQAKAEAAEMGDIESLWLSLHRDDGSTIETPNVV